MGTMPNELEQLRALSVVVADTGDPAEIERLRPAEATTNPSLILAASRQERWAHFLRTALHAPEPARLRLDRVLVAFGCEILRRIPGRVSTEVDARLSFDTRATVEKARRIIALYEAEGIPRDRVLIKIACTWEGTQAARVLELEGIHTNLTLIFCLEQAEAAAQAGAAVVSPFVGRIRDWHAAHDPGWNPQEMSGIRDPGVRSVSRIWRRFRAAGARTQVLAASFRSVDQVLALAGCDLLTIPPKLLDELAAGSRRVMPMLAPPERESSEPVQISEARYRYAVCMSPMVTDKLAEGIRRFVRDTESLEELLH